MSSSVCGANLTAASLRASRSRPGRSTRRVLQAVLGHQGQVVALIEDLAPDLRVPLAETPDLAVLLGHELLVEGGDLQVEVELGKVEIGGEALPDMPVAIPGDVERGRLVGPLDLVEVQEPRELSLGGVRESHRVALQQGSGEG